MRDKLNNVTEIHLGHNNAIEALSLAIASGALPNLLDLGLGYNQIGDSGMIAFADAIKPTDEIPMGALPSLQCRWP